MRKYCLMILLKAARIVTMNQTPMIIKKKYLASRRKKGAKNSKLKNVEIRVEDIRVEDRSCPNCGREMDELKSTVVDYLVHEPEKYVVHRYIIHNYTCHKCNDDNMDFKSIHGDISMLPKRLINESLVTPSLVSHFAYEKVLCALHCTDNQKILNIAAFISAVRIWQIGCAHARRII